MNLACQEAKKRERVNFQRKNGRSRESSGPSIRETSEGNVKQKDQQEFEKQAAKLLSKVDTDVHYEDIKTAGISTLCGQQSAAVRTSMKAKEITCQKCIGKLNWNAIPNRPR